MAFTVTVKKRGTCGDLRYVAADCQFDNSYGTGGESLTASDLGYPGGTIQLLLNGEPGGLLIDYDYTNSKLLVRYPTGGATAAPTSVSAVPAVTSGASTASAVNATTPALTPGVGKEVGNTTDLSTITVRVLAFITGV